MKNAKVICAHKPAYENLQVLYVIGNNKIREVEIKL